MRFLFAMAFLGLVLAVAGCTGTPSKPIDTKPPESAPSSNTISIKKPPPQ